MPERRAAGPRCAALVGPYLSGKTTLLEHMLFVCGAVPRRGTIKEGNTAGDASPESRNRKMRDPEDVFTAEPLDLWAGVLRRQGPPLDFYARYPPDPSLN